MEMKVISFILILINIYGVIASFSFRNKKGKIEICQQLSKVFCEMNNACGNDTICENVIMFNSTQIINQYTSCGDYFKINYECSFPEPLSNDNIGKPSIIIIILLIILLFCVMICIQKRK